MNWFKLRSHKKVDLAQMTPLSSREKADKAKKKSHFSFKNLFKSHKPKESVVADSNKNQVEKKSFFGRKKKTAKPEAFEQNSEIYKSRVLKRRHEHSLKKSNDNPGNNSSLYNSYSGAPVVLPKSSSQPRNDQQSVDYTTGLAPQPPINNSAGTKIEQNPQPEAKRANTPAHKSTVSGGVGNVDPGIKPSVDLKTELTEKQAEIQGYQQTIKEYKSLNDSLWIALRESLGEKKQCPTQCTEEHGQLMKKLQASYDYIKTLQTNIEVASNGVEAALEGDNKLSTEAQKAYEQIDPKQFGQIKAEIDGINKEIANFKVKVEVARQQKTLDACMAERKVLSDALPNYFFQRSGDPECMKFSNKLAEIGIRIHNLRSKNLNSERFVNNPGSVQVEVGQIQADLAKIRNELKDWDFRELTNAEKELTQIQGNIKKLPRSPEKTRYLSAINKGLRDLKNTRAAYEPKDISKWSPMPAGFNSVGMNFHDEVMEITESVKNAIPEAVREGKGMPSVTKPVTSSVSTTKPSAEEIEAARSAFSQTYELYEKLFGPKLEDTEAHLKKDYENQMQHLQLMREYVTNNVSVKDGKWDLLKQINGQMQATENEYEDVHGNFEANEVVQGYKAVKTAMDNLQQAIEGKGDLKTCQQQMEGVQKKLLGTLAQELACGVEDVMTAPGIASDNAQKNIRSYLSNDINDLIREFDLPEAVENALMALDPENLPQEVEDYNKYVDKSYNKTLKTLTELRGSVRKELKDGPEKTKFLNDINQGIAKLRELKQDWTAGADALNDLDDWKLEFDYNLNDIMQPGGKDIEVDVREKIFQARINNRCEEQTQFLNSLKSLAKDFSAEQMQEFNEIIDTSIEERQETVNSLNTEKFNGNAEGYQQKVENSLDDSVSFALKALMVKFPNISKDVRTRGDEAKKAHTWNLNMEGLADVAGMLGVDLQ